VDWRELQELRERGRWRFERAKELEQQAEELRRRRRNSAEAKRLCNEAAGLRREAERHNKVYIEAANAADKQRRSRRRK
jgi:hypothetical protein